MIPELSHVTRAASHTVATALAPKSTAAAHKSSAAAGTSAARGAARSNATPAASGASGTTPPATDHSTITSGDFLTLLVSELKNQDPTQPTDPNAYITQLVGVNSLEQLIQINTGITSLDTTAKTVANPSVTKV